MKVGIGLHGNCSTMNWDGATFRNLSKGMAVGGVGEAALLGLSLCSEVYNGPCLCLHRRVGSYCSLGGQPLLPLPARHVEAAAHWFLPSAQPCHVVDGWH